MLSTSKIIFDSKIGVEYVSLGKYFIACFSIAFILVVLSWLLSWRIRSNNRVYSYECGFSPFISDKIGISLHTYYVPILFILFDIEVALLLPIVFLDINTPVKLLVLLVLLLSLLYGLALEIYSGLLDFLSW